MKSRLNRVKSQLVGRELYADEIRAIFEKELNPLGVEVTTYPYGEDAPDGGIGKNQISANGFFEAQEWDFEAIDEPVDPINIELMLVLYSEDEPICINNKDWLFLAHQVEQTLEHEMIHREQNQKRFYNRGGESRPIYDQHLSEEDKQIVYLSDPDELDAYSNDVKLDLLKHYSYMGAYARLREYKKIKQDESPIFVEYVDTFGWNSETVHTLVKKALKRLET